MTPVFLMKKFCDPPPAFSWPPYSEENDSPLMAASARELQLGVHMQKQTQTKYIHDLFIHVCASLLGLVVFHTFIFMFRPQ